ncbi:radical SAM protein [Syntrophorhabdus aromaticivorans]|uniref:radical SAM protein n=1 Tax=Syntrophorhabdus aromaticivorans TaxID=328301 RepID=UPI0009FFE318|nr:radical SAM protein [Syntrophorhabdus aromaticivorans]
MPDRTALLTGCELCPRRCGVDRRRGQTGFCGVGNEIIVAYHGAHFGEEPPISGTKGSGNIFFSSCNLRCLYCQNYQISHAVRGQRLTTESLVETFLALQGQGLHNINLVSPTPYAPFIGEAIEAAKNKGVSIPFVYNTHAYENEETLKILDGLIDIYLPDFKYWNSGVAGRLSGAPDYPETARRAILEMKRQVGHLVIEQGIATRGLLIRHLVLPSNLAGSRQVLSWIGEYLGHETHVSLMAQYNPLYKASRHPMLRRRIKEKEYDRLIDFLVDMGFEHVFIQEPESSSVLVPDFERAEPFAKQRTGKQEQEGPREVLAVNTI